MSSTVSESARLTLAGHEPVAAQATVVYRPARERTTRALIALLGFWALVPIVFFIPPHIPWALIAFVCGIYFSIKQWRGEYIVQSFTGECPRCHSPLTIAPGTRIRLPHKIDCFNCHHEPSLEVAHG